MIPVFRPIFLFHITYNNTFDYPFILSPVYYIIKPITNSPKCNMLRYIIAFSPGKKGNLTQILGIVKVIKYTKKMKIEISRSWIWSLSISVLLAKNWIKNEKTAPQSESLGSRRREGRGRTSKKTRLPPVLDLPDFNRHFSNHTTLSSLTLQYNAVGIVSVFDN